MPQKQGYKKSLSPEQDHVIEALRIVNEHEKSTHKLIFHKSGNNEKRVNHHFPCLTKRIPDTL